MGKKEVRIQVEEENLDGLLQLLSTVIQNPDVVKIVSPRNINAELKEYTFATFPVAQDISLEILEAALEIKTIDEFGYAVPALTTGVMNSLLRGNAFIDRKLPVSIAQAVMMVHDTAEVHALMKDNGFDNVWFLRNFGKGKLLSLKKAIYTIAKEFEKK